MITAPHKGSED